MQPLNTFTHTPQSIEGKGQHAQQRWSHYSHKEGNNDHIGLVRWAFEDSAELHVRRFGRELDLSISVRLTAIECENLARALLDTAHDLLSNPAEVLMQAQAAANDAAKGEA